MKRKVGFGLFLLFLVGQLSLPLFGLAAEPIAGLEKVSEFKAENLLDLLNNKIDLKSFLGKPVKIPLTFSGEDADSLYLIPPQFFIDQKTQKITVTPTRTIYLANGKNVSNEKIRYVRDELEKELNKIMNEKKDLLDQLRAVILNQSLSNEQLQAKFKELKLDPNQSSWIEWLLPFVQAEDSSNIDMGALQDLLTKTQSSTGTATENLTEDDALAEIVSSDNTKSRELLSLLLLLLIYKNAIAEADNTDKTTCVTNGGEWVAEQCVYPEEEVVSTDEKNICSESGGEWKTDFSQRKICMAACDATDDDCTDRIVKDEVNRSGCICPTDQCVTAAGDCTTKSESTKDKDEDEIPDSSDKCPSTKDQGDGVNMNETSADYGCSCADLQAKGRIQQRQCPGGACDGAYLVQYNQASGTDSCQNGVISQFSCVANRYPSQQCQQQTNNNNNQNQNQNQNSNSWQDMLKDLMGNKNNGNGGGQQGGGQQGGGDQGGGDQKSGCSSCSQQPQQTEQQKQEIERRINELPNLTEKDDEIFDKALEELNKRAENTDLTQEQYDQEYQRLRDEQFDRQLVELNRQAENTAMTQNQYDAKLQQIETQRDQGKTAQSETGSTATNQAEAGNYTRTYPDGSKEEYTYHENGSVTKTTTDANGTKTEKTYDKEGKEIPGPTAKTDGDWGKAATSGGPDKRSAGLNNTSPGGDPDAPFGNQDSDFWDNLERDSAFYGEDTWNNPEFSKNYSDRMFNENIALDEKGFDFFESQVQPGFDNSGTPNTNISEYVGTPGTSPDYSSGLDMGEIKSALMGSGGNGFGLTKEEIAEFLKELENAKDPNDYPGAEPKAQKEAPTLEGGETPAPTE